MSLVTCFALFVTVNLLLVELSCDGCSALKDVEDDDAEAPKRHPERHGEGCTAAQLKGGHEKAHKAKSAYSGMVWQSWGVGQTDFLTFKRTINSLSAGLSHLEKLLVGLQSGPTIPGSLQLRTQDLAEVSQEDLDARIVQT